ncbi:MAG: 5'-methylthioadenosine/adenosylhomocysteine nucleosidase, partial [Treponema sp.]|nr:5'-methylthioadenosine/adenosylhomocysteine nucleosidase [Treponema sp.]
MIGIIGAMEEEVVLLRSFLEQPRKESSGSFEFITGKLEGRDVVLLRCGIGKVQAAAGCAVLIDRFRPKLVFNTGVAGGIDSSLTFADVIIADGLLYHDVDVTAFKYAPGQIPGQPQIFKVPGDYIAAAEKAVDELKAEKILPETLNHVRGLIGSGDVFVCKGAHIEKLKKLFPGLRAVEMEGAAIAHCSALFNTPALVIRSLSDIAGVESPVTSEQFTPLAAKHSAEIVRRFIRNM